MVLPVLCTAVKAGDPGPISTGLHRLKNKLHSPFFIFRDDQGLEKVHFFQGPLSLLIVESES